MGITFLIMVLYPSSSSLLAISVTISSIWSIFPFMTFISLIISTWLCSTRSIVLQPLLRIWYGFQEVSLLVMDKGWMSFFIFFRKWYAMHANEMRMQEFFVFWYAKNNAMQVKLGSMITWVLHDNLSGRPPIVESSQIYTHKPLTGLALAFWIRFPEWYILIVSTFYNMLAVLWWEWQKVYYGRGLHVRHTRSGLWSLTLRNYQDMNWF